MDETRVGVSANESKRMVEVGGYRLATIFGDASSTRMRKLLVAVNVQMMRREILQGSETRKRVSKSSEK